jgi:ABC-type Fe3+ transport system permease subunit
LIVFLACIKELPITLLLGGSTGFKTLAFRTWDRYNEALWHDAGVSGLSLLLVALLMTIITLQWKRNA